MTLATRPRTGAPARPNEANGRNGTRAARADRRGIVGEIADRRLADLRAELDGRSATDLRRAVAAAPAPRPFALRLAAPGLHLIAEIKRSSPSAGQIYAGSEDIVARARAYQAGGAAAISVLCEPHWFGGSVEDLRRIRSQVEHPIPRC